MYMQKCPYMCISTVPSRGGESVFFVFCFCVFWIFGKAWVGGGSPSLFQTLEKHKQTEKPEEHEK